MEPVNQTVCTKIYKPSEEEPQVFPINRKEIWRYAGYVGIPGPEEPGLSELLENVMKEALPKLSYKVCYLRSSGLPFETGSENLAKLLRNSEETVMFAATVGLELDRLIARYEHFDKAKALLLQAFGAERVEALCDAFCNEVKIQLEAEGKRCTPRFSPGYGDLPLEHQKDFFRLLECNRRIGISLGDSLLMTPSKSVTAVFGIESGLRI